MKVPKHSPAPTAQEIYEKPLVVGIFEEYADALLRGETVPNPSDPVRKEILSYVDRMALDWSNFIYIFRQQTARALRTHHGISEADIDALDSVVESYLKRLKPYFDIQNEIDNLMSHYESGTFADNREYLDQRKKLEKKIKATEGVDPGVFKFMLGAIERAEVENIREIVKRSAQTSVTMSANGKSMFLGGYADDVFGAVLSGKNMGTMEDVARPPEKIRGCCCFAR